MKKRTCPECNKPLTWIKQYQRWYCKRDKMYPALPICPSCKQPLNWISEYKRWYCYKDKIYPQLPQEKSQTQILPKEKVIPKETPNTQTLQQSHATTKEIIREVVLIPCAYCDSLMPQTSTFCSNCGARRKG